MDRRLFDSVYLFETVTPELEAACACRALYKYRAIPDAFRTPKMMHEIAEKYFTTPGAMKEHCHCIEEAKRCF